MPRLTSRARNFLAILILPSLGFSQYLFPDWIVDEFLSQGVPLYVTEPGTYDAEIQGYSFHWEFYYSSGCYNGFGTDFDVSGTDIDFSGCNSAYVEYVVTINWLAYFGSFPGGGVTVSSTNLGSSIEDMSDFVLDPVVEVKEAVQDERSMQRKGQSTQPATVMVGGQYENASYRGTDIKAFSIPVAYSKSVTVGGKTTQRGVIGNISYASFAEATKINIRATTFFNNEYNDYICIGYVANISLLSTSADESNVAAVNVIGAGGFASYHNQKDKLYYSGGVLVEPKYGGGSLGMPVIFGGKAMVPLSRFTTARAEFIRGFDPMTETDSDSYSKIRLSVDVLGGIYTVGFQKVVGAKFYSNTILFLQYHTLW